MFYTLRYIPCIPLKLIAALFIIFYILYQCIKQILSLNFDFSDNDQYNTILLFDINCYFITNSSFFFSRNYIKLKFSY